MLLNLPIVNSCDGCGGSCCLDQSMPPFKSYFESSEFFFNEEWDSFKRDHPDLVAEIKAEYARKEREHDWQEQPCFWLNQNTGRCKHYEVRPSVCRDFVVGGKSCLAIRKERGIR